MAARPSPRRTLHLQIGPGSLTSRFTFLILLTLGLLATVRERAVFAAQSASSGRFVSVIVKIADEPVATYNGGLPGFTATSRRMTGERRLNPRSPATVAYRAHLAQRFANVEAQITSVIPSARVAYRYDIVIGGIAVQLPEDAVGLLINLPGVVAVYPDEPQRATTTNSPAFIGVPTLWGKLGGQSNGGQGIIVGVIDTGIWPEHPSFSDPDPSGKPYIAPPGTRQCEFSGGANPGPAFSCNGKIIGAYRFMTIFDQCVALALPECVNSPDDFTSARDSDGHGDLTASIAAGNGGVATQIDGIPRGAASGIAPRAHIIAYKVLGPATNGESLGYASDFAAAVQQAILDGVDVINFSIGGQVYPYLDVSSLAFRDAYAAGVFVAAGPANDGPAPDTITQVAGWVMTVGASTQNRSFVSQVTLASASRKKLKLSGESVTDGIMPALPVALASSVGDEFCLDSAPDGAFAGKIAVCKADSFSAIFHSFNAAQRGAQGMLIYKDPTDGSLADARTPWVPTVQLNSAAGTALVNFMNTQTGVVATFTQGAAKKAQGDVMAAFSSRGGPNLAFGIGKPDITAPGVQILGGDTPQHWNPGKVDGELFQVGQGTSMATPHVAGAAALLKQLHPDWTPGQIKSALMTSASAKKLFKEDGKTPFDAFDAGSGRIDLTKAPDPGLTFDVPVQDFSDHAGDLWMVNYPSLFLPAGAPNIVTVQRTAHSELASNATWKLKVSSPPDLHITVPGTLVVPAGGEASFNITVDKSAVPTGEVRFATVQLTTKGKVARFPITAVGFKPLPDLIVTDVSASSPVTIGGPITVSVTVQNIGDAAAGQFFTNFYISVDATLTANWDHNVFAYCDFTGLAAGTTLTCAVTIPFPFLPRVPTPPGEYHVLAIADDPVFIPGRVLERDETNNILFSAGTITVQ